jgi:hypothetical protein
MTVSTVWLPLTMLFCVCPVLCVTMKLNTPGTVACKYLLITIPEAGSTSML